MGYLASQGVRLTGSARARDVEILPGFAGSRIGLWRSNARRSVLNHIQRLWPGEPGALMQAMLIGGRAFFGRELKTNFQRTGTYHILVVSGINVGILAFAFFWALRRLPMGEETATVLTILFSWGYAFLADLGPPIVRATITLTIYLLTRLLFRDRNGLNALGIAALGILVAAPRTLFEASFQLTFLSVIAVAGIAVPILQRTLYPFQRALRNIDSPAYDFSLPTRAAQFRSDLRLVRENLAQIVGLKVSNFVLLRGAGFVLAASELILISAIIEVSLALPMAWYFHRTTTMSLPANVLVIPLASILMPAAVLAVALSYVSFWLAHLPALVAGYSLAVLTGTIRFIGHWQISDVRLASTSAGDCLCRGHCLWHGDGPGAPALAAGLAGRRRPAGRGHLDHGRAAQEAVAPRSAGNHGHRRGTGRLAADHYSRGQDASAGLRRRRGASRILILTSARKSSPRISGVAVSAASTPSRSRTLIPTTSVECAASSPTSGRGSCGTGWIRRRRNLLSWRPPRESFGVAFKPHTAGDAFDFGGVQFRVLNPQPGTVARESGAGRRVHGAAPAISATPRPCWWAIRINESRKFWKAKIRASNLLKIGHHGSPTSSTPEFLQAVSPQFAVVSAGYYNSFHHPRPEVMKRFADRHIRTYRTDLAGAVSFYLDGTTVSAQPAPR